MKKTVSVFWDYSNFSSTDKGRYHLKNFFDLLIGNNKVLGDYLAKDCTFQFHDNPELFSDKIISENSIIVFVLVELKQGKDSRTSFHGLHLVKQLRKNHIKLPIVLFTFLNEASDFDFYDKEDFINPRYMQFCVRLPELKLQNAELVQFIRELSDSELSNLIHFHYNKKKKTNQILNELNENLIILQDDDTQGAMNIIKDTMHAIVKWVPSKNKHPYYLVILPNKLKRKNSQAERLALLEKEKNNILDGLIEDDRMN